MLFKKNNVFACLISILIFIAYKASRLFVAINNDSCRNNLYDGNMVFSLISIVLCRIKVGNLKVIVG